MVLLGLSGTREISGFAQYAEPSIQILKDEGTKPSFAKWGPVGHRAKEFVEALSRSEEVQGYPLRPVYSLFMQIEVIAGTTEAAAEAARRKALRLIDLIAAAHPTARLRLSEVAAVAPVGANSFEVHSHAGRVARRIHLDENPPAASLVRSVRASALIRQLDDPLTRASFSWIAFETAGLKITAGESCGRALAMLCLRHLAIVAYRDLQRGVSDLADQIRSLETKSRLAKSKAAKLKRAEPRDSTKVPGLRAQAVALEAVASDFLGRAIGLRASYEKAIAAINQLRVTTPGLVYGQKGFSHVVDIVEWQRQLTESRVPDRVSALSDLLQLLPRWATTTSEYCAGLLSDGTALRAYLTSTEAYFAQLFDGLYSARNVHLHSGVSDVAGSVALGVAAPLLIDTFTELCLHWQESEGEVEALAVVDALSVRFASMTALNAPTYDLATATSPTATEAH